MHSMIFSVSNNCDCVIKTEVDTFKNIIIISISIFSTGGLFVVVLVLMQAAN